MNDDWGDDETEFNPGWVEVAFVRAWGSQK